MKSDFESIIEKQIAHLEDNKSKIDLEIKRLRKALAAYLNKGSEADNLKSNKLSKGKQPKKQVAILNLFKAGEFLSVDELFNRTTEADLGMKRKNLISILFALKKKGLLQEAGHGHYRRPPDSEEILVTEKENQNDHEN